MADDGDRLDPTRVTTEDDQEDVLTTTSAWLSNWWQSAKEKSSSALEFMKRDLSEFSQVVQNDTVSVVSNTTAILKEKLKVDDSSSVAGRAKQGFNDLFQTVSGALYPVREPDSHELVVIRDSQPVVLDQWQAEVYQIQSDLLTFSHEPRGPPELYEKWLEGFDLQEKEQEIKRLLNQSSEIQSFYNTLVSSSVSESEFWQRYFYRVWQVKESRRADLVKRVQPKSLEEEIPWDEDDVVSSTDYVKLSNSVEKSTEVPSYCNDEESRCTKPSVEAECSLVKEILSQKTETVPHKSAAGSDGSNVTPPSCDSSEKGTSDEWEKDFDLELNDTTLNTETATSITEDKVQDEEWENWE